MIINSNYRQPYDGLQGMGQDKRVVWNRFEEWYYWKNKPSLNIRDWRYINYLDISEQYSNSKEIKEKIGVLWDKVRKHSNIPKNNYGFAHSVHSILIVAGKAWVICRHTITIKNGLWEQEISHSQLPEDYSEYNKILNCPVVLIENNCICLNPVIYGEGNKPNSGLPKINPYDLYQWVFDFLAPTEPEIEEPLDKYKILAHGMDESSFRREPGGPTRKRKKQPK